MRDNNAIRYISILALGLTAFTWSCASSPSLTDEVVYLDSDEGERLLRSANAVRDLIPLLLYLETQDNLTYCGVGTAVTLLNALGIPRPISPTHGNYRLFRQSALLSDDAPIGPSKSKVQEEGMTLHEFAQLLRAHGAYAATYFAQNQSEEDFRRIAQKVLEDERGLLAINYLRTEVGQEGGGHISPIAAYDESTDRVLVLDVASYRYSPAWIRVSDVWRAMLAKDTESKRSRGFVVAWSGAHTYEP